MFTWVQYGIRHMIESTFCRTQEGQSRRHGHLRTRTHGLLHFDVITMGSVVGSDLIWRYLIPNQRMNSAPAVLTKLGTTAWHSVPLAGRAQTRLPDVQPMR